MLPPRYLAYVSFHCPESFRRATVLALICALGVPLPVLAQGPSGTIRTPSINEHAPSRPGPSAQNTKRDDEAPRPPSPLNNPDKPTLERLNEVSGKLPLSFEPNEGQTDSQVKFISRGSGYSLFLTSTELVLALISPTHQRKRSRGQVGPGVTHDKKSYTSSAVRMELVGANANAQTTGLNQLPGRSNYFIGNSPGKWRTDVANYGKVKYTGVYPGIDMVYYGNQRQLEYDFIVAPHVAPGVIRLGFKGAKKISIDKNGDLALHTLAGVLRQRKPYAYQDSHGRRRTVSARYSIDGEQQVSFELGDYDATQPLVIDPVLIYSTYLGGSGSSIGLPSWNESSCGIAVDSAGNAYVVGSTPSSNFPTTPGAFQTGYSGAPNDVFVAKLNPAGTTLIYSTFLGGAANNGSQLAGDIAVDSEGNAYVTGETTATDFPVTAGAFQTTAGDNLDAFITKLNPQGSGLVYSTYLRAPEGRQAHEHGHGIAVDPSGNAYVTGVVSATPEQGYRFPTTAGAFQPDPRGNFDGFVTKLNAAGSALIYSTFLGGTAYDSGGADIAVDPSGFAYVVGGTSSTDFPVTGSFQSSMTGGGASFVTKLNQSGGGLVYSTYLNNASANNIAADSSGNAYVSGYTTSTAFPTTTGAYKTTYNGGSTDVFVTKFTTTGTLGYSTYIGGSGSDSGGGIAVDSDGNAYIAGTTDSPNFPVTSGPQNNGASVYVAKLRAGGSALLFSTTFGGTGSESATDIAVDSSGDAYVTGTTNSADFPTSPNAFQRTYDGNSGGTSSEVFVTKVCIDADRDTAPDANVNGTYAISTGEYKFAAALDPTVLDLAYAGEDLVPGETATGRETEIWGQLYRPSSGGPFPLVVFLHGNHQTCGTGSGPRRDNNSHYTLTGKCPGGYQIVNNHMGYDYLARRLASHGYIVVSVNANRGVTGAVIGPYYGPDQLTPLTSLYSPDIHASRYDPFLILTRGRLVLRHLQKLSEWNRNGGAPRALGELRGKIDFSNVGVMGHSRGGEGVRAAYNIYRASGSPWPARIVSPVTFKGIFEIAPTDGAVPGHSVEASGVAWNVLLPMCDGDLVDLPGVRPFDRLMMNGADAPPYQKSTFTVWGANHNYYNTQWQQNDSSGCINHKSLFITPGAAGAATQIGSAGQQQTGLSGLIAFFRANVGATQSPEFNRNFNTLYNLPGTLTSVTRVDRGFSPSPNQIVSAVFENFDGAAGTNTFGHANDVTADVTVLHGGVPNHDPTQKAGVITWESSGADRYFQSNWSAGGTGTSVSSLQTLDFRISRAKDEKNSSGATNFSIQLVMADGTVSGALGLCKYAELTGPVGGLGGNGGLPENGGFHPILQTVRIPLADFTGADLNQIRGVRFIFDSTPTGVIYLANIRMSP